MTSKKVQKQILDIAVQQWNISFGGTSGLDISDKMSLSNEEIMKEMEELCKKGKGSINANVELYVIKMDPTNSKFDIPSESTTTHVFFPSKDVLEDFYFESQLVREDNPEYLKRLHCGANQLELVMFSDEVLTRYFDHPELYEISDSLSGGSISTKLETPDNRYLYIKHGKRKLGDGRTAVAALYKDLYKMTPQEQRHWHSYELDQPIFTRDDPNFQRFLSWSYDGTYADFSDPIKDVFSRMVAINKCFGKDLLFKKDRNEHFRPPVENTRKAYYDCCSEFYKLIGPDSINVKLIKKVLREVFQLDNADFVHPISQRNLGPLQVLELLEEKLGVEHELSATIRDISEDRKEADHKITSVTAENINYVEKFVDACRKFTNAADIFERKAANKLLPKV